MESWRKAWRRTAPVEPYKDREWVEEHGEYFAGRSNSDAVSDEVAAEEYRRIQALWLLDHVDVLEASGEITSEQAEHLRRQKARIVADDMLGRGYQGLRPLTREEEGVGEETGKVVDRRSRSDVRGVRNPRTTTQWRASL